MVIRRRKSVWFLLGAALYVLVILLGLGNMVASLASVTDKELPVYSVQRDEPLVALTFNCAWEENDIPQLLDLLEKEKIKATFFLVGQWIERYPDSVRQIAAAGHEIGNHSYSHVDFVGAGEDVIRQQMEKTDALIQELTGSAPTLARVPSGSYDSRVIRLLRQQGYEVIQWDVDSVDWQRPPADEITERILNKVQNGSIVLFHSGRCHHFRSVARRYRRAERKRVSFYDCGGDVIKRGNGNGSHRSPDASRIMRVSDIVHIEKQGCSTNTKQGGIFRPALFGEENLPIAFKNRKDLKKRGHKA